MQYCQYLWIAQTSAEGIKFQEPIAICWNFCLKEEKDGNLDGSLGNKYNL